MLSEGSSPSETADCRNPGGRARVASMPRDHGRPARPRHAVLADPNAAALTDEELREVAAAVGRVMAAVKMHVRRSETPAEGAFADFSPSSPSWAPAVAWEPPEPCAELDSASPAFAGAQRASSCTWRGLASRSSAQLGDRAGRPPLVRGADVDCDQVTREIDARKWCALDGDLPAVASVTAPVKERGRG
jgi:hypothetical protein